VGYAGWVIVGLAVAVGGGALPWFEKPLLAYTHPVQLNLVIRLITVVMMAVVVVPLTIFDIWSLALSTGTLAAAYIALAAFLEWVIALTAFYYALRVGTISVVTPIVAAAPIFTALFSVAFLGQSLGALVIAGIGLTVAGIAVLSRFMPVDEEPHAQPAGDAVAVADDVRPAAGEGHRRAALRVLLPSLLAAVTWGVYPVIVEAAEHAAGGPTAGMMLESQLLGAIFLTPFLFGRRARSRRARPPAHALRRTVWFFLIIGVLETMWGVLFYFLVENLGAVITGVMTAATPVFSIMGGVLIWKERLSFKAALGAAMAIAGVLVAALGGAA
jgi:drug/metabolite transporter (DMT)-like permease